MALSSADLGPADQAFARFARNGDSGALALVFDETASELLRVASHLVSDLGLAEDLVQATFLAAIESREEYDSGRAVLPWLTGILVNRARDLRKASNRKPDPRRLSRSPSESPDRQATAAEFSEAISNAIAGLPEPYRPVLLMHLKLGQPVQQIALILGRAPGTVRKQLSRGMEMLRKALPAGLMVGAFAFAFPGRGLAAVRKQVLERAATSTGLGAAAAGTFAGVLVMKKLLISFFAIAVVFLLWLQVSTPPEALPALPEGEDGPGLTAEATGTAEESDPSRTLVEGTVAENATSITAETHLDGIVLTEDGTPIPGAEIRLGHPIAESFGSASMDFGDIVEPVAETTTAGDGTFTFPVSPLRPFDLWVQAEGHAPGVVTACYAGQYQEITLRPGGSVEGRITYAPDGLPASGVPVTLAVRVRVEFARTTTDGQGYYRFEDVPADGLIMEAHPSRGLRPVSDYFAVEPGETVHRDFLIQPGYRAEGRVTDALTGQPIMGAELMPGNLLSGATPVRTGASGRYVLDGMPNEQASLPNQVHVRADGYGRKTIHLNDVIPSRVLDVELLPAGSARGRIVDPAGAPLAGIYVAAVGSTRQYGDHQLDWQWDQTAADGRFELTDLRPDLHPALFVRSRGHGTLVYDFPHAPDPDQPVDFGTLVLREGSAFLGRVVWTDGRPLEMAPVVLLGTNPDRARFAQEGYRAGEGFGELPGRRYVRERMTLTDAEGRFRIPDLSPGTYQLTVRNQGGSVVQLTVANQISSVLDAGVEVEIAEWGQVLEEEIRIDLGLSISGRVLMPDGSPPGDDRVHVMVFPEDRSTGSPPRSATAQGEGRFELVGLNPGLYGVLVDPYSVLGERIGEISLRNLRAGGAELELRLPALAYIEGIVVNAQGDPLEGVELRDRDNLRASDRTTTGADGRFRLRAVEGKAVTVEVRRRVHAEDKAGAADLVLENVAAGTNELVVQLR